MHGSNVQRPSPENVPAVIMPHEAEKMSTQKWKERRLTGIAYVLFISLYTVVADSRPPSTLNEILFSGLATAKPYPGAWDSSMRRSVVVGMFCD